MKLLQGLTETMDTENKISKLSVTPGRKQVRIMVVCLVTKVTKMKFRRNVRSQQKETNTKHDQSQQQKSNIHRS